MKRIFTIFTAVLMTAGMFIPQDSIAQSPEKVSYQAVIRNSSNDLVTGTQVGMQISILQGSETGTAVYVETQTPTTNDNGLISIEIGTGTTTDDFSVIDWANDPYFIKTETDPAGGTSYTITGTSQLLSVPYALYAKTAETISGSINETDPVFGTWDKSTGISITKSQVSDFGTYVTNDVYGASVAAGITALDTANWNAASVVSYNETDPVFDAWDKSTGISITKNQVSDLGTYVTSETDPVYNVSIAAGITATDTAKWNAASVGSYNEVDPAFSTWDKSTGISITKSQVSDFGTYVTTETDPVYNASTAAGITATDTAGWNATSKKWKVSGDSIYTTNSFVGIGTTSPKANFHLKIDQNESTVARVENATSTTAAGAQFDVKNDVGTRGVLLVGSSAITNPSYAAFANRPALTTAPTIGDGISIAARQTIGDIRLYTGGVANTNERMRISSAGNVGIGTITPTQKLEVIGGTFSFIGANTNSDTTNKYFRLGGKHYKNAEKPITTLITSGTKDKNLIGIGGGTSAGNAATEISFFTAENNTTTTGIKRMSIGSTGDITLTGNFLPKIYNQVATPDIPNNSVGFWFKSDESKFYIIMDVNGTQKYTLMTSTL